MYLDRPVAGRGRIHRPAAGQGPDILADRIERHHFTGSERALEEAVQCATGLHDGEIRFQFVARGYSIDVPEDMSSVGAAGGDEKGVPSVLHLLKTADVAAGEAFFKKKCALCHNNQEGGANMTGPNLWGVVGHDKGSHAGFNYSSAMAEAEGSWTFEELNEFIYKPKQKISGTIMAFAGEKNDENRANLLVYLHSMGSSAMPIPDAPAPEEEVKDTEAEAAPAEDETTKAGVGDEDMSEKEKNKLGISKDGDKTRPEPEKNPDDKASTSETDAAPKKDGK